MHRYHFHNRLLVLTLIVTIHIVVSCNVTPAETERKHQGNAEKPSLSIETDGNKIKPEQKKIHPMEDYILNCEVIEFWEGSIQGAGSREIYILGECYNEMSSYDIVLVPKKAYRNNLHTFNSNRDTWLNHFNAFVFFIGKQESKDPENEFDKYDYIFPSNVKVVKSTKDRQWLDIGNSKINSFEELGRFKVKLIGEHKKLDKSKDNTTIMNE